MSPRNRRRWLAAAGSLLTAALWASACSGDGVPAEADDEPAPSATDAGPTPTEPPATEGQAVLGDYSFLRETYGEHPSQFGTLWIPTGVESAPVVVLIHGGFWQDRFGLGLMDPLAEDLAGRGYAVWNIEYRRVGADGGGWPTTFDDVAAAMDHLAALGPANGLDLDRVAVVGHSAGGHLALWAAGREAIPAGQPWADPAVIPRLTVGQAPVVDMVAASEDRAGDGAVDAFLGGSPAEVPERYVAATPSPEVSGRLLVVLGDDDAIIAPQWAGGAPEFDAARVQVADTDHFDVIDPAHRSWELVVGELDRALRTAG